MTTTATTRARVPILMYHEIAVPSQTRSRLAVSPARFATQLDYLRDAGFTAITAADLSARLAGNAGPLPERPVVLTFDDGYADFHRVAMPLLDSHGFTGTLFVTTGWAHDAEMRQAAPGRMLTRAQLAEAALAGIELAAHTRTHPQLDQLPEPLVRDELGTSKHWLEDALGQPVPGLAYPFGYSSARVRRAARDLGHGYACAVGNTMMTDEPDLFALPRLTIRRTTGLPVFQEVARGASVPQIYLQDRVLTKGWAMVRRTRAAIGSVSRGA